MACDALWCSCCSKQRNVLETLRFANRHCPRKQRPLALPPAHAAGTARPRSCVAGNGQPSRRQQTRPNSQVLIQAREGHLDPRQAVATQLAHRLTVATYEHPNAAISTQTQRLACSCLACLTYHASHAASSSTSDSSSSSLRGRSGSPSSRSCTAQQAQPADKRDSARGGVQPTDRQPTFASKDKCSGPEAGWAARP